MSNNIKVEDSNPQVWGNEQVFENRNKEYGAYLIRKSYTRFITTAFSVTVILIILAIVFPFILSLFNSNEIIEGEFKGVVYRDLGPPPPIEKTRPLNLGTPPRVKAKVKYMAPIITKEPSDSTPTTAEIKKNNTGSETVQSTGESMMGENIGEGGDYTGHLDELDPEFPGGESALKAFVSKNIRFPASALRMRLQGVVVVSFLINKEGQVEDVRTEKSLSPDCDREAERVIKSMPLWIPGRQSGKPVQKRFGLPVRFDVNNTMAQKKSKYAF